MEDTVSTEGRWGDGFGIIQVPDAACHFSLADRVLI